jgi:hypothetical protein
MRIVMRFHFPNLDRPKKAAKSIARLLGGVLPLSRVQNGLATALGYRDWHELDLAHASRPPQPLDQDLPAGRHPIFVSGENLLQSGAFGLGTFEVRLSPRS